LKSKKIIQSYIWDVYLSNVDANNPFEISKFEKKIKSLCYAIKDETLKKYILEDFLSKLKGLTPIQNFKKVFTPYVKKNFNILNETKQLHREQSEFSKAEIKERSILFILLNYLGSAENKLDDLLKIDFMNEQNSELKKEIINQSKISDTLVNDKPKIDVKYNNLVNEIEKNTNLKNILLKKNEEEREEILNDLIEELKEMNQLKQIEFLENKVAKNLDEGSYSELIKLKSQLNRE
jgi:hypothetical protein